MPKKDQKITLERLAQMIERGFADTVSRKEFHVFRDETEKGFVALENKFDALAHVLKLIQEELTLFRRQTDVEVLELRARVERLERKLGMAK